MVQAELGQVAAMKMKEFLEDWQSEMDDHDDATPTFSHPRINSGLLVYII